LGKEKKCIKVKEESPTEFAVGRLKSRKRKQNEQNLTVNF
jgi:hypothetical protein